MPRKKIKNLSEIFGSFADNCYFLQPDRRYESFFMSKLLSDKIEYLILLVAEFASRTKISEAQTYRYLSQYGALPLVCLRN